MKELFRWEQPIGTTTELAMPLRGASMLMDVKRSGKETQWYQADVTFGTTLDEAGSHFFIILDAWFNYSPNPLVPYAGRGAIFYKDRVAVERFDTQEVFAEHPFAFEAKTYRLIAHANDVAVAVWVRDVADHDLLYFVYPLEDRLSQANISMIAVGAVAGQGSVTIANQKQGRFV